MKDRIRNILDKAKAKNSTYSERMEMLSLFHQPDKEQFIKEQLLDDLQSGKFENEDELLEEDTLFFKIWEQIEKIQFRKRDKKRYLYNFLKLAIALIIGLLIGVLYNSHGNSSTKPVYYEARAPKGSVIELILPDSSVIFLNADSKIKYSLERRAWYARSFTEWRSLV